MSQPVDMTSQRFGSIVVIKRWGSNKHGRAMWKCQCDCGNEILIEGASLRSDRNRLSCGCRKAEGGGRPAYHGLCGTDFYAAWSGMKGRCKSDPSYKDVSVCERWQIFMNFFDDMLPTYFKDAVLARYKDQGNYEPGNCRWTTKAENSSEIGYHWHYLDDGRNAHDVAKENGIPWSAASSRVTRGWSLERAVTEPLHLEKVTRGQAKCSVDSRG